MISLCKSCLTLLILSFYSILGLSQVNPQFEPIPANFDVNNPNALRATNINYDDIEPERQLFHLFLPDTVGNHPLVIYIHGGGFTGGNPGTVFNNTDRMAEIKYFLENGFAYASFGYRVISTGQPDMEGVIKSLGDSKRALQFVRHYANDLYINPNKIALIGTSAGSGTSLWLGTRSDMADPNADDPVLQESTRVCAVAAIGSQATYDLYKWETQVYQDFDGQGTNYTLDSMANLMSFERVSNFYGGLDSVYQMVNDPTLMQYREDVDMLFHMSSDDPPIYIYSRSMAVHPSDDLFHHSFHGREINNAALAANISEVKAYIPALSINTTNDESINEFLVRQLNSCATITSLADSEKLENNNVIIYPNPADAQFSIKLLNEIIQEVEVYSLTGKLINRQYNDLSSTMVIPTSTFNPGIYIVHIISKKGHKISKKIIIE